MPADFIVERDGIRRVGPAFAVTELLAVDDGAAACDFLRRTSSAPGDAAMLELWRASGALAHAPGHADRRRVLADLEEAPWSLLELRLHRLLRSAGITGWSANVPLRFGPRTCCADVAFPDARVAIEADGRLHHSSAVDFERDRERWNLLAAEGWIVIRVTWAMVHASPDLVIAQVRAALASRS